jgi:branched-chain amino acid transport system permease protein
MSPTFGRFVEALAKKRVLLAILAVMSTFPFFAPSRYYMILLAEMLIWALLAMSYDLVLGYTGLVSFGQAAMFGVGAYACALLMKINVPFPIAVLTAMLIGGLVGLILGAFTRRVSGIYYALVTLAFAEVIFAVFSKWVELSGGETGLQVLQPGFLRQESYFYFAALLSIVVMLISIAVIIRDIVKMSLSTKSKIARSLVVVVFLVILLYYVPTQLNAINESPTRDRAITLRTMNTYYFLAFLPLVLSYFVASRIVSSPMGRVFVAIRENEERTKMLGYNVFKYKLISSTISGILAALAGAIYAPFALSINPVNVLSSAVTVNVLLYSILGGLGTLFGPMIGAGIITLLANELTRYVGEYWMLVLGLFYLFVIIFLPYGIVVTWRVKGASARRTFKKLIESIKPSSRKATNS